jgi:hypothetical protein
MCAALFRLCFCNSSIRIIYLECICSIDSSYGTQPAPMIQTDRNLVPALFPIAASPLTFWSISVHSSTDSNFRRHAASHCCPSRSNNSAQFNRMEATRVHACDSTAGFNAFRRYSRASCARLPNPCTFPEVIHANDSSISIAHRIRNRQPFRKISFCLVILVQDQGNFSAGCSMQSPVQPDHPSPCRHSGFARTADRHARIVPTDGIQYPGC